MREVTEMNTEKVSVNVNVVDLGKIDFLVDRGIYTTRTDFITKAITNELNKNQELYDRTLKEVENDVHIQIGNVKYDAEKLLKFKNSGSAVKLYVIGRLTIQEDVPLQLAQQSLLSIKVFGVSKMSRQLTEYYMP